MSNTAGEQLPPQTRTCLVDAALFLTAYQLLRNAIVDRVRDSFLQEGWHYECYDEQVLVRHKSRFHASLLWLVEVGALQAAQVDEIHEIRRYRNKVAYDIVNLLQSGTIRVETTVLQRIRYYLDNLDQFFARYPGTMVDTPNARALPNGVALMDHICGIVIGHAAG